MRFSARSVVLALIGLGLAGCGGGAVGTGGGLSQQSVIERSLADTVDGMKLYRDYSASLITAITSSNSSRIFFDGNLYYQVTVSQNTITVNYFTDPNGTNSAGSIILTSSGIGTFPETFSVNVAVTGGAHPARGNLSLVLPSNNTQNFTLTGTLQEQDSPFPWGITAWTFDLTSNNGLVSGSLSATDGVETISLTNITASTTATGTQIKGTVGMQPPGIQEGFTLDINNDGSETIALADGTTATIPSNGTAKIVFFNGVTIFVPNFYGGV